MTEADRARIVAVLLAHYPAAQGIYLFGSQAAGTAWPASDVAVAVLLPEDEAERAGHLALGPAHTALEATLRQDVDLLNARLVSSVMQKAVVYGDLLFCGDRYAADPDGFDANDTRQDAATLNVLRACEQSIDLANHHLKRQTIMILRPHIRRPQWPN